MESAPEVKRLDRETAENGRRGFQEVSIAAKIATGKDSRTHFEQELDGFCLVVVARRKSSDMLEYLVLWHGQQRQFDQKWLRNPAEHADMLEVAHFSGATDLSSILERVQQIRLVPFRRKQALPLIIAASLFFLVLMTLEFQVEEILRQLLKMRF